MMTERVDILNKREDRRALIFGATGLVGGHLWRILEEDGSWSKITCIGRRRPPGLGSHPVVKAVEADLFNPESFGEHLQAEVTFICLGTTMKKAGSKAAFWRVDVELPELLARACARHGVKRLVAISAMGIHPKSIFFYNRAKASMEEALRQSGIPEVVFVRPGLLLGDRPESRFGEEMGATLLRALDPLLKKLGQDRYRAIPAANVARAMSRISQMDHPDSCYENDALHRLGSVEGHDT